MTSQTTGVGDGEEGGRDMPPPKKKEKKEKLGIKYFSGYYYVNSGIFGAKIV